LAVAVEFSMFRTSNFAEFQRGHYITSWFFLETNKPAEIGVGRTAQGIRSEKFFF